MALQLSPGAALELLIQETRFIRQSPYDPPTGPPEEDTFTDLLASLAQTIVLADEMLARLKLLELNRSNYHLFKRLQLVLQISRASAESQALELLTEKPHLRTLGYG